MNKKSIIVITIALAVIVIQFIPVQRENPSSPALIKTPANIVSILERSCLDCHSYETKWPFYSRIAPVSWLIAHDVNEGRIFLNFSRWELIPDKSSPVKQIITEIEEGEMPPLKYTLLHPGAKLTDTDISDLKKWGDNFTKK